MDHQTHEMLKNIMQGQQILLDSINAVNNSIEQMIQALTGEQTQQPKERKETTLNNNISLRKNEE